MASPHRPVDIEYVIPPALESLRTGWIGKLQSGAIVSSLIAAVEAQLLSVYTDSTKYVNPGPHLRIQRSLEILTYVALVCSISATLTSLVLTEEFGDFPARAARHRDRRAEVGRMAGSNWDFLRVYHIRSGTRLIALHWLMSVLAATLCTIASTAVFVITQKPLAAQIIVSIATAFSVIPIVWYFVMRIPGRNAY